jgi:hypothetical protein
LLAYTKPDAQLLVHKSAAFFAQKGLTPNPHSQPARHARRLADARSL